MKIWAIADLHLCFGAVDKSMERFGAKWQNYTKRIEENWRRLIAEDDLVLIAGDISWAMKLESAKKDFDWIDALPGTKVIIRGNHDYWWSSLAKVRAALPPSIHAIQNDAFHWKGVSIAGTRLWDSTEYNFDEYVAFQGEYLIKNEAEEEKIFLRELGRLKLSVQQLDPNAKVRIVMTHYPPISADLRESRVSKLLEEYRINYCIFGHLHQVKEGRALFGVRNGVHYLFTASDYLQFEPYGVKEIT